MMAEIQGLHFVLKRWKKNPSLSKREIIRSYGWKKDTDVKNNKPFSQKEIDRLKKELNRLSPAAYKSIFPEND